MKSISFAIVVAVAITLQLLAPVAEGSLYNELPNPKRKGDGCYATIHDIGHMTKGQEKELPSSICGRVICANGGGGVQAQFCGTGVISVAPGEDCSKYTNKKDYENKPYPGCCIPKCINN